jgi:hypothetical protein
MILRYGQKFTNMHGYITRNNTVLYYELIFFGPPFSSEMVCFLKQSQSQHQSNTYSSTTLWQLFLETNCSLKFKALHLLLFPPLSEFNGLSVNLFLPSHCHSQHLTQSLDHNYDLMLLQISSTATWQVNLINEATPSNVSTFMKIVALYIFIKNMNRCF